MGLDMFVFEIHKPNLKQNRYTTDQLGELGHSYMTAEEFDAAGAACDELRPFCAKALVTQSYYDTEKMIADYNLPENSYIGMISYDKIAIGGTRDGEYVRREISREEISEKYTLIKDEECYIWHAEDAAYWRKAYELQDFWHEVLDRPVENCGYYRLGDEEIDAFWEHFGDTVDCRAISRERNDSALFYHEWY